MLFLLEPLFLHRWLVARGRSRPELTFRIIIGLHWFLLAISVLTDRRGGRRQPWGGF